MPLRFNSVPLLLLALGLTLAIIVVVLIRRPAVPLTTHVLSLIGLILLSLATGGAYWQRARGGEVLVMLDVSPSTRTATYRDRAALDRRLHELLGDTPCHLILFAGNQQPDRGDAVLADLACDHTVFAPPTAEAILLFSDARFESPPFAPRTFIVIDPALEQPSDAAVETLQIRGRELVARVNVAGKPRKLSLQGTTTTQPIRIDAASRIINRAIKAESASAQFSMGDPWPENDGLWINVPPPTQSEKWWWGASAPPGWREFDPSALPVSGTSYLAPAVIVLNNLPTVALSAVRQPLQQYVRDLGGSVVILGGDHSFAAGDYGGTALEAMSPLASHPPQPAMQWIILVDGSGSMGEATPEGSRWQVATMAVKQLLPHLPPEDIAMPGSFAGRITWWSSGKSVRETMTLPLPPIDLSPRGPTNLQQALVDITRSAAGDMPKRLIIITDADASIENPQSIATEMKLKNLSLHVLAIGQGSGLTAMREIAVATGGSVVSVDAAKSWSAGLLDLSRGSFPKRVEKTELPVRFISPLNLPARRVALWNRVWMKSDATALAEAVLPSEKLNPAARWRLGAGEVASVGFAATTAEAVAIADLIARPPHDPRFHVTWDTGRKLQVSVDAIDAKTFLNGQALSLELIDAQEGAKVTSHALPQTAPGLYQLTLPAPRRPMFASVRHGGTQLDQIAVAGRYAPEFDAIGNDHTAMHELAQRTGGQVIDPRQNKPIDFHWTRHDLPLESWLAGIGSLFIALGLVKWRMRKAF